jgi:excisionase family DNA binding protein
MSETRFMTLAEVAREARVSIASVRRWLRLGRMCSVRLGKRRLIPRVDFERLIQARSTQEARQ